MRNQRAKGSVKQKATQEQSRKATGHRGQKNGRAKRIGAQCKRSKPGEKEKRDGEGGAAKTKAAALLVPRAGNPSNSGRQTKHGEKRQRPGTEHGKRRQRKREKATRLQPKEHSPEGRGEEHEPTEETDKHRQKGQAGRKLRGRKRRKARGQEQRGTGSNVSRPKRTKKQQQGPGHRRNGGV